MESLCIRVPKTEGELSRKKLIELCLLDNNLKIKSDAAYLLIPVLKPIEGLGILEKDVFEIAQHENPLTQVPGAYELIGNIAIIDQHEENAPEIAKVLLQHKNIKTIFQQQVPFAENTEPVSFYLSPVNNRLRQYTGKTDADTFLMLHRYILRHDCQLKG